MVGPAPQNATVRASSRAPSRAPARFALREPHEKYTIDPNSVPDGMIAEWKALKVLGMVNRAHMIALAQAGWQPARAEQFPEHSGYGVDIAGMNIPVDLDRDGKAITLGNVDASAPIEKDGQIMMLRPKEMADESREREKKAATEQVKTQFDRLTGQSKREVGHYTKAKTEYVQKVDEG